MVILYSNERVVRCGDSYYARIINFTDFLVLLSARDADYRLALSCDNSAGDRVDSAALTEVGCSPQRVLELPYLDNRYQSFLFAIRLAARIRRFAVSARDDSNNLAVVSPGLNSVSFALTWLLPRNTRWYFFIRGDTRKTVDEIYRASALRRIMTAVIDLFQWRVHALMRRGNARSFVFGEALKEKFYRDFPERTEIVSPLLSGDWIETPPPEPRSGRALEQPAVLYVGRLSAEKNLGQLVDACALAAATGRRFNLTIVGDGPLEAELKSAAQARGIGESVRFTGRVANGPELIRLYDTHDVFCLPSKTEGTPRAVAEAVARGLPVVASDVGSISRMFTPGTVHLLETTAAEAILEGLCELFENLEERRRQAGLRRAEAERHTLDFNVDRVYRIIQGDRGASIDG